MKDEAEFLVADVGQRVAPELRNVDAIEQVAPAGRLIEAAEDVHHCGLAGAARAHDGDKLASLDLEGNVAHRVDLDIAGAVRFRERLEADDGGHFRGIRSASCHRR